MTELNDHHRSEHVSDLDGTDSPNTRVLRACAADPRYAVLVRRRSRFGWLLTAIMLAVFFAYILLIAFDKALLAQPIFGGTTSLGIPVGIGVILAGVALTGIYVWRANREFDRLQRAIVEDASR